VGFESSVVRDEVFDWVLRLRKMLRGLRSFELGDYSMVCFLSQQAIKKP